MPLTKTRVVILFCWKRSRQILDSLRRLERSDRVESHRIMVENKNRYFFSLLIVLLRIALPLWILTCFFYVHRTSFIKCYDPRWLTFRVNQVCIQNSFSVIMKADCERESVGFMRDFFHLIPPLKSKFNLLWRYKKELLRLKSFHKTNCLFSDSNSPCSQYKIQGGWKSYVQISIRENHF